MLERLLRNPPRRIVTVVEIPDQKSLTVKLVPVTLINDLVQTRDDENRWEAIMWAFIGAVLGIVVNWLTATPIVITQASIILLAALILMAGFAGWQWQIFSKRSEEARSRLHEMSFQRRAPGVKASTEQRTA